MYGLVRQQNRGTLDRPDVRSIHLGPMHMSTKSGSRREPPQVLEVLYLMDPHCGWCFGYSATATELAQRYEGDPRVSLEVVTGGLFYPAIQGSAELAEEKRPIAARIERHFGVTFSDLYFERVLAAPRLDSYPSCALINAAGVRNRADQFGVTAELTRAAFSHGVDISRLDLAAGVLSDRGYELDEMVGLAESPKVEQMTRRSFALAREIAAGFPSVFVRTNATPKRIGGVGSGVGALSAAIEAELSAA